MLVVLESFGLGFIVVGVVFVSHFACGLPNPRIVFVASESHAPTVNGCVMDCTLV